MKGIIFSGMRPTGKLHLGNYFGALSNWIRLQDEYKCYYGVVDWHALTTGYDCTEMMKENTIEMVIDWLSAGIDPNKGKFSQSAGLFNSWNQQAPDGSCSHDTCCKSSQDSLHCFTQ